MTRFWILLIVLLLALTACTTTQAFLPLATVAPAEFAVYTVQPGDTISQIALRYHVSIEELIERNKERYPSLAHDPSTMRAGWQLVVPKAPTPAIPELQVDLKESAKFVIEGINAARAENGLALIRSDVALTHIANNRSTDMIARNYFSHHDPETSQEPFLRYLQATNFKYRFAGENIAEIKNDAGIVPPWLRVAVRYSPPELAAEFVTGWLKSPDHRANIFNTNYRRTGVALAVSGDGRRIVATQTFAD